MSDYKFLVQLRKFESPEWVPMAAVDRETVDAIVAHVLNGEAGYDVARVSKRLDGETFMTEYTVNRVDMYPEMQ